MRLLWEERAWEEYCYWQTQDKKTFLVGGVEELMRKIELFINRRETAL